MCGNPFKSKPKTPKVVQVDPAADQAKLEAQAASKANAEAVARKKNLRQNSLLATGAQGVEGEATTSSVMARGKQELGG